jgi:carbamoyltransferase
MNILGVGFLADASAAVLCDGHLVSAISEERINRVKLWHGVPEQAIERALQLAGLTMNDIDLIATHGKAPAEPPAKPYDETEARIRDSGLSADDKARQIEALRSRQRHETTVLGERTPGYLEALRAYGKPMHLVTHHTAHAASAFHASGWDEAYILTADGWGEDASSTVWHGNGLHMKQLALSNSFDSLGYFYGAVTKALGYIPHRHEGKVLGLAAHCPEPKSYATIRGMIDYDPGRLRFLGRYEGGLYRPRYENPELQAFIRDFSREDIAAATQQSLEDVVCRLVADIDDNEIRLCLAGGVFANVRLNQKLAELPKVREISVFPNMGDGGLSIGAAYLAHVDRTGDRPRPLDSVLLGDAVDETEITAALQDSGLPHRRLDDIESEVAKLIAEGNVVARCAGGMEFGPRALGNRSILYQATEPDVNQWLNDRLGRSEFMPFAPATLVEEASNYYQGLAAGGDPARYMAMTFDCTQRMKDEAPAAVHVDGTARPQLVSRQQYPGFHRIISAYREMTGLCSVINTSFNMHEEPIVRSAGDAIRAFQAGNLPYLALGDYLVEGPSGVMRGL